MRQGLRELSGLRTASVTAVIDAKCQVLEFLIEARREGKAVAGYGAPAKGNTLLNYCGVGPELLRFTVDRSPHKQGRYLPGSHIPVFRAGAAVGSPARLCVHAALEPAG